jgi:SAM-dependent methyltransferase
VSEIRAGYDAVAGRYAQELGDELAGKSVDRALYGLFAELVGAGARIADVGCGPGHVGAHLATLGLDVTGIDLSPGMVEVARTRYPHLQFRTGDMTVTGALGDGGWAGAVLPYSIVHFGPAQRALAFTELARVIRPGGWLLAGFHICDADHAPGTTLHRDTWWDQPVDIDFVFHDPGEVAADLEAAGFSVRSRTDREPDPDVEHQSRRSYLLARRRPA